MKRITSKQAAELLGLKVFYANQVLMKGRKLGVIIRYGPNSYDEESILKFKEMRKVGERSNLGEIDILNIIKNNYIEKGTPITYRQIVTVTKISSTSAVDYRVRLLEKNKEVEIFDRKIYPFGFREKIMELAKKEFANDKPIA